MTFLDKAMRPVDPNNAKRLRCVRYASNQYEEGELTYGASAVVNNKLVPADHLDAKETII